MRAAAILGLSSSEDNLKPFQEQSNVAWQLGMPAGHDEADAVLIFGGDGTVHRHLAQLVRLQLPVLVVPCGSGNDFARALNLRSVGDALSTWTQFVLSAANHRRIDLGLITPLTQETAPQKSSHSDSGNCGPASARYFCCVGGVGLDTEIARRANRLPAWLRRRGGYLFSLLPALRGFQSCGVKIHARLEGSADESVLQYAGPAMVAAFANAATYGDGIRIAPNARLEDGKLDICVVGKMGKIRLLRLFPKVYLGSHLSIPEVKYFQTESLRMETARPMEVYADGEYVCATPIKVTACSGALQVIVPSTPGTSTPGDSS
jgi:diacylglycerol kinase (ATP)